MAATAPPKSVSSCSSSESVSIGYQSDGVVDFEAEVTSFHRAMKEKKSGHRSRHVYQQDMVGTENSDISPAALPAQDRRLGLQSKLIGRRQDQGTLQRIHSYSTQCKSHGSTMLPAFKRTGV
jgi:hypothetical protein